MKLKHLTVATMGLFFGLHEAQADVICSTRAGALSVRSSCRSNEKQVNSSVFGGQQGPMGPQGAPGYSAISQTPCSQAIVGDWSGYLAGSGYADIEHCTITVTASGGVSGGCWQYTSGGKNIPLSGGQITVSNVNGYQTCYISGKFNFSGGINSTIDANMTPDKNNIVGVHWNSAGGLGTFSATRLIK